MNKKGFTIVELLAVIIILAVIALIASSVVTSIIENSKKGAAERGTEIYLDAVETAVGTERIDGKLLEGTYLVNANGDICPEAEGVNCSEDKQIKIEMIGDKPSRGTLKVVNGKVVPENVSLIIKDYEVTYDAKEEKYVAKLIGEEEPEFIPEPKSFADDSWETIVAAVKEGNISAYKVGDKKEVTLTGEVAGTYTIRIANMSTPAECNTTGFSQTACGFVIEFEDVITKRGMNLTNTSIGGWKESEMRKYINENIYNSLPLKLKNNIIDTMVISLREKGVSTNYITTDKLYLLAFDEIYNKGVEYFNIKSRQLDYYNDKKVTTTDYAAAEKQYEGKGIACYTRHADPDYTVGFYVVSSYGSRGAQYDVTSKSGVAPAFRIG